MNIAEQRNMLVLISGILVAASIGVLIFIGLNFGIDFRGGTLLERALPGDVSVQQVRDVLVGPSLEDFNLGGSFVQPLEEGASDETVMLIRTHVLEGSQEIAQIDAALEAAFGDVVVRRTDLVGPTIGDHLIRQAVWAIILSGLGIVAYITFRFEYRFGVSALVGLAFDVLITLALMAIIGREINTPFVAAILTVVGYSINDKIVIFDRIRENLSLRRRESLNELVNKSVAQSITRSLNTSLTSLFVLLSLYFLGGSTIQDFTLTLFIGIIVGTVSSLFLSSPFWLILRDVVPERSAKTA